MYFSEHLHIHERDEIVENDTKEGLKRIQIEALTEFISYHVLVFNFPRRIMTEIELQGTEQPSFVSFAMIRDALYSQWAMFALKVSLKSRKIEKWIAVFLLKIFLRLLINLIFGQK